MKRITAILFSMIIILSCSCLSAFAAASPFTTTSYTFASQFKGLPVHQGIDVSYYQDSIDWTKVKKAGVEFAIIRCGYRGSSTANLVTDVRFNEYITKATQNGIKVGVYFFSQAKNNDEAIEEAKYTLNLIKPYKIEMPVYFDIESYGRNKDLFDANHKNTLANMSNAFCKVIKDAGYTAGIYANTSSLTKHINTSMVTSNGYEIWCAQYNSSNTYAGTYSMWQYTSTGKVSGIQTANGSYKNVDCNFLFGDKYGFAKVEAIQEEPVEPEPVVEPVKKVAGVDRKARTTSSYTIKWNGQSNADGYYVYRSVSYGGTYKKIAATKNTYYKNTGLTAGKEYYYRVKAYNKAGIGVYSDKYAAMVKPLYDRYGKTAASKTIRTHAGTSYNKVISVPEGKSLTILGYTKDADGNTWYRVKYKVSDVTYKGYVKKGNMTITKKGTTTSNLNIRKAAGASNAKLGTVPSGTRLVLKSTKDVSGTNWYKITYDNGKKVITGWISGKYVKAINLSL